jgi:hypothetical protein
VGERNTGLLERSIEARRVAALDVEPEKAGVDVARSERWKQCQEVSLGASDSRDLVDVEDSHDVESKRL